MRTSFETIDKIMIAAPAVVVRLHHSRTIGGAHIGENPLRSVKLPRQNIDNPANTIAYV